MGLLDTLADSLTNPLGGQIAVTQFICDLVS
jgi:hypothetical protein